MERDIARRLRTEYLGALPHVINRQNNQRDWFESPGAAEAFLRTRLETAGNFGWLVHACGLKRNHFHLADPAPQPTLVDAGVGFGFPHG